MFNIKIISLLLFIILLLGYSNAYAELEILDRTEINAETLPLDIAAGNLFGYTIENIGDLDGDGINDLAVIKHIGILGIIPTGTILILFMNNDGTVKDTNEITMEDNYTNGIGNVCLDDLATQVKHDGLRNLAFVGDLDNDGKPTLALGATGHTFNGIDGDGVVYMLELNSDGTVDNCLRIIPGENGFNPDDDKYSSVRRARLGIQLIATDLNGDGQNELLVGAANDKRTGWNLWVFFLNSDGRVLSHPSDPIYGISDIGIPMLRPPSDGSTLNGGTKIVYGVANHGNVGSIHIVNLTSDGAFLSSTRISGDSVEPRLRADSQFGTAVTSIGDVDGDGVNDIMVGSMLADELGVDVNTNVGMVHILFLNSDDTLKGSQNISNESEFLRTGIRPLNDHDNFGTSIVLWKDESGQVVIAIGAWEDDATSTSTHADYGAIYLFTVKKIIASTTGSSNNGGSGNEHDTRPTFGINHKTNIQQVEGGFSFNGISHTITDNDWIEFAEQEIPVGETNYFSIKTFAEKKLQIIEFLFGIPNVGESHKAELGIEIYYDYIGEIIEVKVIQKTDVIDVHTLKVSTSESKCRSDDDNQRCVTTVIAVTFLEPLRDKIMALKAIDYNRRTQITYLDEGFDVSGYSLNPMKSLLIPGPVKYEGQIEIVQTEKYSMLWVSDDNRVFERQESGMFTQISNIVGSKIDSNNLDRIHSEFYKLLDFETEKAQLILDKLCTRCSDVHFDKINNTFAYEYPPTITRGNDTRLQLIIDYEERKAEAKLAEIIKKIYSDQYIYR